MVGADGQVALPWLEPLLRRLVERQQAHALLIHGPEGVGQFELALSLAQAWLCESAAAERPCGGCAACRMVQAHSHPDLRVVVPDALAASLGWGEVEADTASKAKPSKEIRVEAVRGAVGFAQTTSARGRAKAVVLFPAERMNAVAANTLLKTLEEPPGSARFVLASAAPDALLATIRSRCQAVALVAPAAPLAVDWLAGQGVADAPVLLAAAGGQPQAALAWAREGIDAAIWRRLPMAVSAGESAVLAGWPVPRAIDALQKLCHDAACVSVGAAARYFATSDVPGGGDPVRLQAWMKELTRAARHAEHPWNAGLLIESLVLQGRRALGSALTSRN